MVILLSKLDSGIKDDLLVIYNVEQLSFDCVRELLKQKEKKLVFREMVSGKGDGGKPNVVTGIRKPRFSQGPGRFGFGKGKGISMSGRDMKTSYASPVVAPTSVSKLEESLEALCNELRNKNQNPLKPIGVESTECATVMERKKEEKLMKKTLVHLSENGSE